MNCKISEKIIGNYILDLNKSEIKVILKSSDGKQQALIDKIKLVEKDLVTSKKIKSGKGDNYFFVYYLDAKTKSVIRQDYKKGGFDLFLPDGPEKKSYCKNVKANWHEVKKIQEKEMEKKAKEEERKKTEQALIKLKEEKRKIDEKLKEQKNRHEIYIVSKKWHKLSKANSDLAESLKDEFNDKAIELCSKTKKFNVIDQNIEVVEMDETPVWGTETVIRYGIDGIIECK